MDPGRGLFHPEQSAEVPLQFQVIAVQHAEKFRCVVILVPAFPKVTRFPKDLRFHPKALILRAFWKRDFHADPPDGREALLNPKAGRRTCWNLIVPLETKDHRNISFS